MASASEGWVISGGLFLHYTGGTWTRVDNPPGNLGVYGVMMVSPTEGWAVGNGLFGGTILHCTTQ
jgi:hypothetical protein